MAGRWWAVAAGSLLLACARPAPTVQPRPRPRPAPAPVSELEPDPLDRLPVIPVAASGEPTVELYAVDVHLDWLALQLAEAPVVSPASSPDAAITGRLSAPSRRAAFQALVAATPQPTWLRPPELTGSGRKVDLSLARMPAPELALLLAELLGDDIITTIEDAPVTVIARQAPADGLLRALTAALGASLRKDDGVWILEPRPDAPPPPRHHHHHARLRVELRLDDVPGRAAADLVRAVARLGDPRCPWQRPISARLRAAPVDLIAHAMLDTAGYVGPACGTPRWDGGELPAATHLVGVARAGARSAALLAADRYLVVTPDPALAKVAIGPTSIGIRQKKWQWEGALAAPALPAELPGTRDFVGDWRLAATLRDGAVWRALLVGDAGAVWVASTETDRVLSIEPGEVVLPPERPDEPPIVLHLRRAPR